MIKVLPIPVLKDNYIWVLINPENKAIIVDPGDSSPIQHFIKKNNLIISAIFITHHHWDHTDGLYNLSKMYPTVPIYGSEESPNPFITQKVNEEMAINIKDLPECRVIAVPGHTLDHTAYLIEGMLFSGDTLFAGGCGRVFEGTFAMIFHSLTKLAQLPEQTLLYCGHEYTLKNLRFAEMVEPSNQIIKDKIKRVQKLQMINSPSLPSTIEDELQTNPFLRCKNKEVIASAEKYAGHALRDEVEVFTALRKWKDGY